MNEVQTFLHMGGHGLYVWLSYGLAASVVVYHVLSVRRARRVFEVEAKARGERHRGARAN